MQAANSISYDVNHYNKPSQNVMSSEDKTKPNSNCRQLAEKFSRAITELMICDE